MIIITIAIIIIRSHTHIVLGVLSCWIGLFLPGILTVTVRVIMTVIIIMTVLIIIIIIIIIITNV